MRADAKVAKAIIQSVAVDMISNSWVSFFKAEEITMKPKGFLVVTGIDVAIFTDSPPVIDNNVSNTNVDNGFFVAIQKVKFEHRNPVALSRICLSMLRNRFRRSVVFALQPPS